MYEQRRFSYSAAPMDVGGGNFPPRHDSSHDDGSEEESAVPEAKGIKATAADINRLWEIGANAKSTPELIALQNFQGHIRDYFRFAEPTKIAAAQMALARAATAEQFLEQCKVFASAHP